jgi:hypothetical protein
MTQTSYGHARLHMKTTDEAAASAPMNMVGRDAIFPVKRMPNDFKETCESLVSHQSATLRAPPFDGSLLFPQRTFDAPPHAPVASYERQPVSLAAASVSILPVVQADPPSFSKWTTSSLNSAVQTGACESS